MLAAIATAGTLPVRAAPVDTLYRDQGVWRVYAVADGGRFSHCAAETRAGTHRLRLLKTSPGDALALATPSNRVGTFEGGLAYNGAGDAVTYSARDGWARYATSDRYVREMLTEGRLIQLDVGGGYVDYSLRGVEAALAALRTCAAAKGRAGIGRR